MRTSTTDPVELAAWLRLLATPTIGNQSARRLLKAFGLPHQIFTQPSPALQALLHPAQVLALQQPPADLSLQVRRTCDWLAARSEHQVLSLGDPHYPRALLHLPDPPLLLWACGTAEAMATLAQPLQWQHSIAVVGSRNPTPQGIQNAHLMAQALAGAGLCVVSGLALGIDGAAHTGALDGGAGRALASVAVLGTGLDRVYPARHQALARRIAAQGVLLSEYALGTPPLGANFPRRNRIIAGLARATLVVEAALHSGSLITARQAAEQGRDVLAVPGSIHATQARGCHALIKQGAKLVETAHDVLEEYGLVAPTPLASPSRGSAPPGLVPEGTLELLCQALGHDPVGLDLLQRRTELDTAALQAGLMALELEGRVASLPGGLFQRLQTG